MCLREVFDNIQFCSVGQRLVCFYVSEIVFNPCASPTQLINVWLTWCTLKIFELKKTEFSFFMTLHLSANWRWNKALNKMTKCTRNNKEATSEKCNKVKHLLSICVSSCRDVVHHVLGFFDPPSLPHPLKTSPISSQSSKTGKLHFLKAKSFFIKSVLETLSSGN